MENYQAGNTNTNSHYSMKGSIGYFSKTDKMFMSKDYNLKEYRQKYIGNGSGDDIYNKFMKWKPGLTPVSNYAPLM